MNTVITESIARRILDLVDQGLSSGLGRPEPGHMCVEAAVCYALGLPHGDDPSCVSRAVRALKIHLNDSKWSSNAARAKGMRRLALAQLGSAGAVDDKEFRRRVVDLAIRVSTPAALRSAASLCNDDHKRQAMLDAADRCQKEGTREAALEGKNAAYVAAAAAYAADAAYAAAYAANAAAAHAAAAAAYAAYAAHAADAAHAAAAHAAAAAAYAAHAAAAAYAADAAHAADAKDKSLSDYAEAVVQILIDMKAPGCQWLPLTETAP